MGAVGDGRTAALKNRLHRFGIMKIKEPDLIDLRKWFEDALNCMAKVDKQEKMRMRRKIRDEIYLLLSWEKPTPSVILNRWEERLSDVFQAFPYGFREDLLRLLTEKMVKKVV